MTKIHLQMGIKIRCREKSHSIFLLPFLVIVPINLSIDHFPNRGKQVLGAQRTKIRLRPNPE